MYRKILILLSKFVSAIIVSILLFNFIKFSFGLLLTISALIITYCFLSFQKNGIDFICEIVLLLIAIIGGYIIATEISYPMETVDLLAILTLMGCYLYAILFREKSVKHAENVNLFDQQKYDISRLERFVNSYNSIGLNGEWGTGKTFITDHFIEKNKDKYIHIVISLLTCDIDNITEILMERLSSTMKNNLIYSKYANQIINAFKNTGIIQSILSFFWKNEYSYGDIFEEFKKECENLDKPILIVFEDIDRIKSKENLTNLFSVAEKLACNNIKIIYQYDETHMQEIGYDRIYLEKYIPYQIEVTRIDMFDIIRFFLPDYENIQEKDFEMLIYRISTGFDIKIGDIYLNACFTKISFSIRKIKIFLDELNNCFNKDKNIFNNKERRNLAVSFFFVKHCLSDIYKEIKDGAQILDHLDIMKILLIEDHENCYSAQEFMDKINSSEDVEDYANRILNNNDNKYRLGALLILGFDLNDELPEFRKSDDIYMIAHNNQYEKRNRLIWYLIYSGESEYTDYEMTAKQFIDKVISRPYDEQREAFRNMWNNFFHGKIYKNNSTIQKFGQRQDNCIFKALNVSNEFVSVDNWMGWLRLYFDMNNIKNIDYNFIDDIYFCALNDRRVYFTILEKFNDLEVIGNMSDDKIYINFLVKYIRALSTLKYINTHEVDCIIKNKELTLKILHDFERKLNKLKGDTRIVPQISNEINTIIRFIAKNEEIIQHTTPLIRNNEPHISTSFSTKYPHQDEFNRLLTIKDPIEFEKQINESYSLNKISVYEVQVLIKKYKTNREN